MPFTRTQPSCIGSLTASAVLWLASSVCAADDAATLELFEKHVRPTLIEQCVRCHGPDKQQGGLRLDSREGWANGGDSGPAIIAGQADSLLLQAIGYAAEKVARLFLPRLESWLKANGDKVNAVMK